ncbi:hypothetical protein [Pseudomonas farris]
MSKVQPALSVSVAGPFMQLAWPVVQACPESGSHYLDTTGGQDWTDAIDLIEDIQGVDFRVFQNHFGRQRTGSPLH